MRNQTTTNPPVDDDLQKAIDNITNTTNIDPVFADPVAAPAPIADNTADPLPTPPAPEPMASDAPAGNIAPESLEPTPPAPEPIAPLNAMEGISELMPSPEEIAPEPAPAPEPVQKPASTPISVSTPEQPRTPTSSSFMSNEALSMNDLKRSALRDLAPLLDHLNMTAPQKFNLYRNIFENLKDYTVLTRAYGAAKEIGNETERAEALLYLIETIDRM